MHKATSARVCEWNLFMACFRWEIKCLVMIVIHTDISSEEKSESEKMSKRKWNVRFFTLNYFPFWGKFSTKKFPSILIGRSEPIKMNLNYSREHTHSRLPMTLETRRGRLLLSNRSRRRNTAAAAVPHTQSLNGRRNQIFSSIKITSK